MSFKWHERQVIWRYRPCSRQRGEDFAPIFRHVYVVARTPRREGLAVREALVEKGTNSSYGMAERRRQLMAAHGPPPGGLAEHPRPGRALWRGDAEAVVGELDDDGVRRLRDRACPLGACRFQDGVRRADPRDFQ